MTKQFIFILISSYCATYAQPPINLQDLDPALRQRILELLQNQSSAPAQQPATTRSNPINYTKEQQQPQQPQQHTNQSNNNEEVELFCTLAASIVCAAITQDQSKLKDVASTAIQFVAKKAQQKRLRTVDDESESFADQEQEVNSDSEVVPS